MDDYLAVHVDDRALSMESQKSLSMKRQQIISSSSRVNLLSNIIWDVISSATRMANYAWRPLDTLTSS